MTMPAQMETIVLRRTFDAPVERVYRAWTDASSIMNWWTCGQGLAGTLLELDVRVGGKMRVSFGNPGEEPSLMNGASNEKGWTPTLASLSRSLSEAEKLAV